MSAHESVQHNSGLSQETTKRHPHFKRPPLAAVRKLYSLCMYTCCWCCSNDTVLLCKCFAVWYIALNRSTLHCIEWTYISVLGVCCPKIYRIFRLTNEQGWFLKMRSCLLQLPQKWCSATQWRYVVSIIRRCSLASPDDFLGLLPMHGLLSDLWKLRALITFHTSSLQASVHSQIPMFANDPMKVDSLDDLHRIVMCIANENDKVKARRPVWDAVKAAAVKMGFNVLHWIPIISILSL